MKIQAVNPQVGGLSLARKATHRPSGEYMGEPPAARVKANGLSPAEPTSTVEISDLVQSSAPGVGTCEKMMVFPSGDQSQSAALNSALVKRRASRLPSASFSAGMTQRWLILRFSPTTRASFLAFWSFSSCSLGGADIVKAICFPSGDQARVSTPDLTSVSCSASPPSDRISQILFLPVRLEVKAIEPPSGDHCGLVDDLSPEVNGKASEPSALAIQT